jgi:hypothetical protein
LVTHALDALGNADVATCKAGETNHDGQITVDEILTLRQSFFA